MDIVIIKGRVRATVVSESSIGLSWMLMNLNGVLINHHHAFHIIDIDLVEDFVNDLKVSNLDVEVK